MDISSVSMIIIIKIKIDKIMSRRAILIIVLTLTINLFVSAFYISHEYNAPRNGDILKAEELVRVPISTIGNDVTWDFSDLRVACSDISIRYIKLNDSVMVRRKGKEMSNYTIFGDSISQTMYCTPDKRLGFLRPELLAVYPMGYTSCATDYFYSEGIIDGSHYIRQAGNSCTAIEAKGRLITPDCDSLRHVLLAHRYRIGTTYISPDFSKSFSNSLDSLMLSNDSISKWISSDSITHSIDTYSWYAQGYRYPVIEQNIVKTFYNKVQVDSVSQTLYFSPRMQEEDLIKDELNDSLRIVNRNEPWDFNLSVNNEDNINHGANLGFLAQGNVCNLSPILVDNSTTLFYNCESSTTIEIRIFNMSGALLAYYINTVQGTHGSLSVDTSQLRQGEYIVNVILGKDVFSFKIFRK